MNIDSYQYLIPVQTNYGTKVIQYRSYVSVRPISGRQNMSETERLLTAMATLYAYGNNCGPTQAICLYLFGSHKVTLSAYSIRQMAKIRRIIYGIN